MRILIASKDVALRNVLSKILSGDGHAVTETTVKSDILDVCRRVPYSIVIADVTMEEIDGMDLIRNIKQINSDTEVIAVANIASVDSAMKALRHGADSFLLTPLESNEIVSELINRSIEKIRLIEENRTLLAQLRYKNDALAENNKKLSEMDILDRESGLYNMQYFLEAFERELARSRQFNRQFSVLLVDFSPYMPPDDKQHAKTNAVHGLGQYIKEHLRRTDLLARFSETEFAVLLPETPKDGAQSVANKLDHIAIKFWSRRPEIEMKKGLATFPEDGRDSLTLQQEMKKTLSPTLR